MEECYFQLSCRLKACNFIKSNTPQWLFFTFFKLYEWCQIVRNIILDGKFRDYPKENYLCLLGCLEIWMILQYFPSKW